MYDSPVFYSENTVTTPYRQNWATEPATRGTQSENQDLNYYGNYRHHGSFEHGNHGYWTFPHRPRGHSAPRQLGLRDSHNEANYMDWRRRLEMMYT